MWCTVIFFASVANFAYCLPGAHIPYIPSIIPRLSPPLNYTVEERVEMTTQCMKRVKLPAHKIDRLADLMREVKGQTDGFYIARSKAIFKGKEEFFTARRCICRGIQLSAGTKNSKHCFSADTEANIVLGLCVTLVPSDVPELPEFCEVPSEIELELCCRMKPK